MEKRHGSKVSHKLRKNSTTVKYHVDPKKNVTIVLFGVYPKPSRMKYQ